MSIVLTTTAMADKTDVEIEIKSESVMCFRWHDLRMENVTIGNSD